MNSNEKNINKNNTEFQKTYRTVVQLITSIKPKKKKYPNIYDIKELNFVYGGYKFYLCDETACTDDP